MIDDKCSTTINDVFYCNMKQELAIHMLDYCLLLHRNSKRNDNFLASPLITAPCFLHNQRLFCMPLLYDACVVFPVQVCLLPIPLRDQ